MLPRVVREVFFPRKALGAVGTLVRGLPSVLPDVVHEVVLAREGFRTELTLERSLTRMLPHVVHQVLLRSVTENTSNTSALFYCIHFRTYKISSLHLFICYLYINIIVDI